MNVGDLVEYKEVRYVVARLETVARVVQLRNFAQQKIEVADDDKEVRVIAQPSTWPFAVAPMRPTDRTIEKIFMTRAGVTSELTPLIEWVPSDRNRPGGPIFFNPNLGIKVGDTLIAQHATGVRSRIPVTLEYGSAKTRQVRSTPTPSLSVYDRLITETDED